MKVTALVPHVEKRYEIQLLARGVCRILQTMAARDAKTRGKFGSDIFAEEHCFKQRVRLSLTGHSRSNWTAGGFMEWTAPAFEEVCLNCEINSYASAKL
jgi:coenzyme PQQ precursor peptide PqqA